MATGSYVVAAGTGEVYSYAVHHHPPVPGKRLPIVIALVELPEGVRMTGELLGVAPDRVRIGAWRDAARATLPPRVIDVTPTFVVASALATRDFQDVHHDRDRAIAGGARDIFLNILTTAGLVQQYVAAWAGPGHRFRAMSIRLGAPCPAGETLTLTGEVTSVAGTADGTERVIAVAGRCGLGDHVTATVRLAYPDSPDSPGGHEDQKG
jgi:acyl dehydratase